jgi:hypothetical protein
MTQTKRTKKEFYHTPILNKIAKKLLKEPRKFEYRKKLTKQEEIQGINQALFPGIEFDHKLIPIKVKQPLQLYELEFIVKKKCNIELRSPRAARIYKRKASIAHIQKELDQKDQSKVVIKRLNEYPYNLQPNLEHYIVWTKGYTWKEIKNLVKIKKAPFIHKAAFYWINDPKFRSVTTIPHYHLIYDKNAKTKTN